MPRGGPRPNSGRKKGTKNGDIASIINQAFIKAGCVKSKNCSALWEKAAQIANDDEHPAQGKMLNMLANKLAPNLKSVEATVGGEFEVRKVTRVIVDPAKSEEKSDE